MYLIQKTIQNLNDNVWIANIITGGVVLAVFGFFFRRLIEQMDKRLEAQDKKVDATDTRSDNIEKNYISRFNHIERKIEETTAKSNEHFTQEIKQLTHEKNNNWQRQALQNGELIADVKNLAQTLEKIYDKVFK